MTQGQWKRIHEQATGALPVGTLTKWGIVLVSLLLAAFLVSQSLFNSAPEEEAVGETGADQPAGPGTQAQVTERIRQEGLRQEAQREAAERALLRAQQLGLAPPGAAEGGCTWRDQRSRHSSRSQRHSWSRSDCAVKRGRGRAERGTPLGRDRAAQALAAVPTRGADLPRREPPTKAATGRCGNSRRDGGYTNSNPHRLTPLRPRKLRQCLSTITGHAECGCDGHWKRPHKPKQLRRIMQKKQPLPSWPRTTAARGTNRPYPRLRESPAGHRTIRPAWLRAHL